MNDSFGAEDDLQLLQMVAEGSRYESTSFCGAAQAYKRSRINYMYNKRLISVLVPFRLDRNTNARTIERSSNVNLLTGTV